MKNIGFRAPKFPIMEGKLDIFLIDHKTKKVVEERHIKNTIVDAGEVWVAELLAAKEVDGSALTYSAGNLGYGLQYIHVGTSSSVGDQNTVDLYGRVAPTYGKSTTNTVSSSEPNKFTVSANFGTNEAIGALKEAGIFSSDTNSGYGETSSVRMFNRSTFSEINKTTSFELTFQWTITIGELTAP